MQPLWIEEQHVSLLSYSLMPCYLIVQKKNVQALDLVHCLKVRSGFANQEQKAPQMNGLQHQQPLTMAQTLWAQAAALDKLPLGAWKEDIRDQVLMRIADACLCSLQQQQLGCSISRWDLLVRHGEGEGLLFTGAARNTFLSTQGNQRISQEVKKALTVLHISSPHSSITHCRINLGTAGKAHDAAFSVEYEDCLLQTASTLIKLHHTVLQLSFEKQACNVRLLTRVAAEIDFNDREIFLSLSGTVHF
jgi:hypothetical protein